MKFTPAPGRIEVKPLKKESPFMGGDELVEVGEVVSVGDSPDFSVGQIVAFEGWGATKVSYGEDDHWVVSTDKDVILGKFSKE